MERAYVRMLHQTIKLNTIYPFLDDIVTLTLYIPDTINGGTYADRRAEKRPTVLVIPGGGYGVCSDREGEPIAEDFLVQGFNTAVLIYCAESKQKHPAHLLAVAAALEQMALHADEWKIDPDKIALCGFSAGGHLSAFYANAYDLPEVKEKIDSRPVAATILGYPVITADPAHYHGGSFANLIGHLPETEEERNKYSCDRLVSEKTPPAFIWSTVTDELVPIRNSLLYATACDEHKVPFELHIFPKGQHGLATSDLRTNPLYPTEVQRTRHWVAFAGAWLHDLLG